MLFIISRKNPEQVHTHKCHNQCLLVCTLLKQPLPRVSHTGSMADTGFSINSFMFRSEVFANVTDISFSEHPSKREDLHEFTRTYSVTESRARIHKTS